MEGAESIVPATLAKRTSLREQVADSLRAAVIAGEMKPGQVYSAPALATRFGVSATPVREAMLDLTKQGLIAVVPNKGFQVTMLSDAELDEITDIRLLLEPPAAARAAENVQAEDVAALAGVATKILDAAAAGDLATYTEGDRQFHGRLLEMSGNNRLVDMVRELHDRCRLAEPMGLLERGLLRTAAGEHLTMCELLAAGDGAALAALMRVHIEHVRRHRDE
ncbi:FCD domain-containing protein [Phytoactinopolyspora sp. XMNu-373]|uniref:FCD domain-containing protein n=2 Tax=Phytoactinopolyspora mesophila TaxID=2650750 RepID=A0A7K3M2P5_9ACTN|nr:FCD domain-containing protein [Phytoactinopolyspora mesophila]